MKDDDHQRMKEHARKRTLDDEFYDNHSETTATATLTAIALSCGSSLILSSRLDNADDDDDDTDELHAQGVPERPYDEERPKETSSSKWQGEQEPQQQERYHWLDSPFAVGPTSSTWAEDNIGFWALCRFLCCCRQSESVSSSSSSYRSDSKRKAHLLCTAFLCARTGAGRVGNMVILWQRMEEVDLADNSEPSEEETEEDIEEEVVEGIDDDMEAPTEKRGGRKRNRLRRPRLVCVLGPFWMVAPFVIVPFLISFSTAVYFWRIAFHPCLSILITWSMLHGAMFASLFLASCSDPGIVYRRSQPPLPTPQSQPPQPPSSLIATPSLSAATASTSVVMEELEPTAATASTYISYPREQQASSSFTTSTTTTAMTPNTTPNTTTIISPGWSWNAQAQTYRPISAIYDPECAVVIDEFSHTCLWTGTAVGKGNHRYFKAFVGLTIAVLLYNVFLLLVLQDT